eukprot:scaffold272431_cov27-Tisochrysis_lutea.AAC.2
MSTPSIGESAHDAGLNTVVDSTQAQPARTRAAARSGPAACSHPLAAALMIWICACRGVAYLFWHDFLRMGWGNFDLLDVDYRRPGEEVARQRVCPFTAAPLLAPPPTVSGLPRHLQHISNFGAWRNRHGDVVFGVNDFDEAAVYDFQIDIWRLAVSMYDHALTNGASLPRYPRHPPPPQPPQAAPYRTDSAGLTHTEAVSVLYDFCHTYVDTMARYVGKEDAQLFEISDTTAGGQVGHFLKAVRAPRRPPPRRRHPHAPSMPPSPLPALAMPRRWRERTTTTRCCTSSRKCAKGGASSSSPTRRSCAPSRRRCAPNSRRPSRRRATAPRWARL